MTSSSRRSSPSQHNHYFVDVLPVFVQKQYDPEQMGSDLSER